MKQAGLRLVQNELFILHIIISLCCNLIALENFSLQWQSPFALPVVSICPATRREENVCRLDKYTLPAMIDMMLSTKTFHM